MAQERQNMAEIPPQAEGEQDPLARPEIPDREPRTNRKLSTFEKLLVLNEHYYGSEIPYSTLSPEDRQRLEGIRSENRENIQNLADKAGDEGVLKNARKALLEFYQRVKSAKREEQLGRGGSRDAVIQQEGRALGPTLEASWDDSVELKELQSEYGGLFQYLCDGVVREVYKEEKGIKSSSLNALAEKEFLQIQRLRQRERIKELRFTTYESPWGSEIIYSLSDWPESPQDMVLAAQAWVKHLIAKLGERDPGTYSQDLEEIRRRGERLIEGCVVRLQSLGVEITETNPYFLRARAFVEGIPEVFANEKMMMKGNTEQGPQHKERFAAHFIENHNAAYLENRYAAYIMHKLATVKEGTYFAGQDWNTEKYDKGQITDYKQDIQRQIENDAAVHDFFTETIFAANPDLFPELIRTDEDREDVELGFKGFFDLREKYHADYGFNDPLERMLLDPDNTIRDRIAAGGDQEALERHNLRVKRFRGTYEIRNEKEGIGFVKDPEREEMVMQKGRRLTDKELLARAESHRNTRRGEIQQDLRDQGASEADIANRAEQIDVQIRHEMEYRRRDIIRGRIRRKIEANTDNIAGGYIASMTRRLLPDRSGDEGELERANLNEGMEGYDKVLWNWVKAYNDDNIRYQRNRWYVSGWDKVRIKIDRPTKLIDRRLSDEDFEAMYEPIDLETLGKNPYFEDIKKQNEDEARFGFDIAKSYTIFLMLDTIYGGMRARLRDTTTGEYIGKLQDYNDPDNPNYETNQRLGLTDANGKVIDPNRKLVRIWDVRIARLQKAIEDEAKIINDAKEAKARAEASGIQEDIDRTSAELTDIMINAQFIPTHALEEKKLVEGDLPVWSQNYLDRSTIYVFTEDLADYGLEVGTGDVLMDHNRKEEFYELLERGRRALQSERDRNNKEFMIDRFPVFEKSKGKAVLAKDKEGNVISAKGIGEKDYIAVVDKDGNIIVAEGRKDEILTDEDGNPYGLPVRSKALFSLANDRGEDRYLQERPRIVNKAGPPEDTDITEADMNMSTSGGLVVPELIPSWGDFGFYPLPIWLASKSIRAFNNHMKRDDEVEFHEHQYHDVKDAPANAKAQLAAYNARKALTGGKINVGGEDHKSAGALMDTYWASVNINALLREWNDKERALRPLKMTSTADYLDLMEKWRFHRGEFTENDAERMEELRQLSYLDFPKEGILHNIQQYFKEYEVLKYIVWYFDTEKEVEQNRFTGIATKGWYEHNTKKLYEFRRVVRKATTDPKGFIVRHKFSPEIGSEISIRMYLQVFEDADYQILEGWQREWRAVEGAKLLARGFEAAEKAAKEAKDQAEASGDPDDIERTTADLIYIEDAVAKGYPLPVDEEWHKLPKKVRETLENIRRRDLLVFMREEGYPVVNKNGEALDAEGRVVSKDQMRKILGYEMPPKVRERVANGLEIENGYPAGRFLDLLPPDM